MQTKIDKQQTKLIFEFSPADWFLRKTSNEEYPYSLNPRIDRSYKGKIDDVGTIRIYLTEEEAEEAKKNGFNEVL